MSKPDSSITEGEGSIYEALSNAWEELKFAGLQIRRSSRKLLEKVPMGRVILGGIAVKVLETIWVSTSGSLAGLQLWTSPETLITASSLPELPASQKAILWFLIIMTGLNSFSTPTAHLKNRINALEEEINALKARTRD